MCARADQGPETLWEVVAWVQRSAVHLLAHDLHDPLTIAKAVLIWKGHLSEQHLIQHLPQRIYIAHGGAHLVALEDLRGHIRGCACDRPRLGEPGTPLLSGDTKVENHRRAGGPHQDVGRLEITMKHTVLVTVGQPVGQPIHQRGGCGNVCGTALDSVGELISFHQLHGQPQHFSRGILPKAADMDH